LGVNFQYVEQPSPDGLAQAFVLGKEFVGSDNVALVLGDNIFNGGGLGQQLEEAGKLNEGARVFAYKVKDPERYGVVQFDSEGKAIGIEEKPEKPKSSYAVAGLYYYDNSVLEVAAKLKPSPRGELEITDLNRIYLEEGRLQVSVLGRGVAWLDTGTPESLHQAGNYVETLQERQGVKIACLEEIAFEKGFIDKSQLLTLAAEYRKNEYGEYLSRVAEGEV